MICTPFSGDKVRLELVVSNNVVDIEASQRRYRLEKYKGIVTAFSGSHTPLDISDDYGGSEMGELADVHSNSSRLEHSALVFPTNVEFGEICRRL